MKKTFKVLVAAQYVYVDESLLQNGLYMTSRPILHDVSETIETMKKRMDDYERHIPGFSSSKAKDTLDNCELVMVEINFI